MANLVIAYILWFFLGIFGVHHFYLNRDRQAFVWWATLGGFFGVGWIRDLWHLPRYVEEANQDEFTYENRPGGAKYRPSVARLGGMLAMGYVSGYLTMFVFPQDVYKNGNQYLVFAFFLVVPPGAVAFGVHLVANIGNVQGSMKMCLLGSAAGVIWQFDNLTNIGGSCLLSAGVSYFWGCKPKTSRHHKSKRRRLSVLFLGGLVYLSMWGSALYFNATVTTSDGMEIPLRDAVRNFFTSPAWTQTKETMYLMWEHIRVNGFHNIFDRIVQNIDPEGEANAYKVLGIDENYSQEVIKAQYRKLAKEWHPDKQKDPAKKGQAQEKFLQIQKAYETLSKIKSRRSQKNQRQSQNDEL